MMTTSNEHNTAPAVPQGWTDADSDSARLALELECLLMDTKDLSVVSKWWASANEALELHLQRLYATPAPAPAVPQCEPVDFDSIIGDIETIDCRYRGDPSYDRDPYYIREQAANVVRRHATYYATPAPAPAQYKDSTPHLSVGEASFESWYDQYLLSAPVHQGHKQRARDAYAAGMGDPLVAAKPAQEVGLTGPVVAWRMRDTGFRRPKYVYFDTKEQAVAHAAHLLQSRDDGHLTELTPLCEAATGPEQDTSPAQERCHLCDCTGDIHDATGEWRGVCPHCKPAQEDEPDPTLSAMMGMPVSRKVWAEFKAWQADKEEALRAKGQS